MVGRVLCLMGMIAACSAFAPMPVRPAHSFVSSAAIDCLGPRVAVHTSSIVMAVPKKRQSKTRTANRKAKWLAGPRKAAILALSRAAAAKFDPLAEKSATPPPTTDTPEPSA